MANNTSPHILNTAANLLGFCLIVITSLQISNHAATSLIDELTSVVAILLIVSCVFSYLSIRSAREKLSERMETIADYFFMVALLMILVIILLIVFNVMT